MPVLLLSANPSAKFFQSNLSFSLLFLLLSFDFLDVVGVVDDVFVDFFGFVFFGVVDVADDDGEDGEGDDAGSPSI